MRRHFSPVSAIPLAVVCGLLTPVMQAADPPSKPYLCIETGMHTASIKRIDADAAGRFLVTASDDKTARVWDLRNGGLLRVLRPPQGNNQEGMLYAVAISPDGATVAASGWTSPAGEVDSVYLFDRESGHLRRRLTGLPDVINHLSYSQDGRYLVAALGGRNGIRIYRTSDYKEEARDTEYSARTDWAEFDRSGRLVTSSYDGFVRLYSPTFHLAAKKQAPGGQRPYTARFSPDDANVAVGFDDSIAVNVLSGLDLSFLYAPDTSQATRHNLTVAWSTDGRVLYASGRYSDNPEMNQVLSWMDSGRKTAGAWRAAWNTVMDLRALPGGRLAFGAAGPALGVFNSNGDILWRHTPDILDHRANWKKFQVSSDGTVVQFGFDTLTTQGTWDRRLARFSIADRRLTLDPSPDPWLQAPRTAGLNIANWEDSYKPTRDGHELSLNEYERSRTLAISEKADSFLLGTEWYLRLFDLQGRELWNVSVPGVAWAVNLTANSRYALAALGDGTIRWYTIDGHQEVLALFVHRDGKRWVAWTPEGFFDASPGGDALVGYHLNQGAEREGEFVKVEQVYERFYRPDLIVQRLKPGGTEAVLAARERIGDIKTALSGGLPPDLELVSPAESDSNGNFVLQVRVKNRGGGIGRVVYRIDGAAIEGRPVGIPVPGSDTVSRAFDLAPGRHQITQTVYNGRNQLESRSVSAWVNVRRSDEPANLFVVAAGVTNYRDHSLTEGVRFAASDAQAVAASLKEHGTGLFPQVIPYTLPDSQATRDNITKTVGLAAARMKPSDVFVLYLAGHGHVQDGQYYFIPWEVRSTSLDTLLEQSLDQEALRKLLEQIPARKTLLVLDTCGSGAYVAGRALGEKAAIGRLAKITGRAVMAASATDQMALEGYQHHGVFTAAFLEGLAKAGDEQGQIQVGRLADFVGNRVPEITRTQWGYEQVPTLEIKGQTFPIARKPAR
jgi:WD40 repeat protein